ncbi:two-component system sensor histidine kinase NtrB [Catenuloplanes atrovinosus]|uniref:histidine kinase n=1 Tax=Catenuloplanes atrovinosus TaxID=137266 RepID=A0AAE4C8T3_9ACTN|nr:ATP-binding protein [Catenuloplanes atrovinosus]MDR7275323.1 PAS domain S-box-containing protein [Catenuloplanes atrovinosus]
MLSRRVFVDRWLCATDTMLGQIRTLFLALLMLWPAFGLWGVETHGDIRRAVVVVVMIVVLQAWSYSGYRRQAFPAWSWIPEGACVLLVLGASDFVAATGLCFIWVSFRALYGRLREQLLGASVVAGIMVTGREVFHTGSGGTVSLMFTALLSLIVSHVLARAGRARDRAAARESAMASAGAGLAASTTRADVLDVALGAALALDREVNAALIFTVAGPALHVIAAAGQVGTEAVGWVTELDRLPRQARDTLRSGGYTVITEEAADSLTTTLRLPRHRAVAMAPLVAHESTFGMLVLGLDRRPVDDLSAPVLTLAGETALTLDQLLIRSRLSVVVEHLPDALLLAGEAGTIRFVNPAAESMFGRRQDDLVGEPVWRLVHPQDVPSLLEAGPSPRLCRMRGSDDLPWVEVEAVLEHATEHDGSRSIVLTARDVSERQRLELELRHAQKLESIGRLAAGIAHEINTPIQFIGDNVRFMENSFADLVRLWATYRELAAAAGGPDDLTETRRRIDEMAEEIEMDYLMEEVPAAIAQTLKGVNRVAGIVRAMKAFGHPGTEEKAPANLTEAIQNTLVVANNEIKYVADVETDLADLPPVYCHLGDVNQVMLNLLVNAAHAIADADRGRGTIRVSTRVDGGHVVIDVADTGTGVPPEIADKLFEPFFTTKEVGTGTGQGLALVRNLITDRHGGTVDFTSEVGVGTVFTVRLPISPGDLAGASARPVEVHR